MGQPFTWHKRRGDGQSDGSSSVGGNGGDYNGNAKARLDRILASSSWVPEFPGVVLTHLAMLNSDHCPLLLNIPNGPQVFKRKKTFRFKAMWIKDEQCKAVIDQAWSGMVEDGSRMLQEAEKLNRCRASLIGWSTDWFGSLASSIKAKRVQLETLMSGAVLRPQPSHIRGYAYPSH